MFLLRWFQYKWRVFVVTKKRFHSCQFVKFNVLNRDFLQMYKRKQIQSIKCQLSFSNSCTVEDISFQRQDHKVNQPLETWLPFFFQFFSPPLLSFFYFSCPSSFSPTHGTISYVRSSRRLRRPKILADYITFGWSPP